MAFGAPSMRVCLALCVIGTEKIWTTDGMDHAAINQVKTEL